MPYHRVIFETEVDADSPEDAAIFVRDMLKSGASESIFLVDVADAKVVVDTEDGNESVIRDDRKRIGPVVMRREGPTGVLTSPVLAEFYGHDRIDSKTDIEQVEGKWLRLHGFGPEAYYDWIAPDGTVSEPFAVITVQRKFSHEEIHPATHMALAAYAQASQY
jgi:hypothetical protein